MDDADDRDDLEDRLDRLEATLEELRATVDADDRVDAGRRAVRPAAETARRLTERLAVPATVAALEANVRLLTYLQERLREYEDRGRDRAGVGLGERTLDRVDDALADLEAALADASLPADAEARRLLERARDLSDEIRDRAGGRDRAASVDDGPTVIEIDVDEELDRIRDEVEEDDGDGDETA